MIINIVDGLVEVVADPLVELMKHYLVGEGPLIHLIGVLGEEDLLEPEWLVQHVREHKEPEELLFGLLAHAGARGVRAVPVMLRYPSLLVLQLTE